MAATVPKAPGRAAVPEAAPPVVGASDVVVTDAPDDPQAASPSARAPAPAAANRRVGGSRRA